MSRTYLLYNPDAGNGQCSESIRQLEGRYESPVFLNLKEMTSYEEFFEGLSPEDEVVLCGGDGTLNCFANCLGGLSPRNKIYYYAVGSGNDFAKDLGKEKAALPDYPINEYLDHLPTVTVNRRVRSKFLNGVGYGIDGYCCEVGDTLRKEKPGSKINYTMIAIKGLLFHYRPTKATVTVDGVVHTYDRVWIAPTMNGRYYGGGMMPTPEQDRLNQEGTLSLMVLHNSGIWNTLMVFPSIFSGKHINKKKVVEVLVGKEIHVEFDRPTPLQIDGETMLGVTEYTATSAKLAPQKAVKTKMTV